MFTRLLISASLSETYDVSFPLYMCGYVMLHGNITDLQMKIAGSIKSLTFAKLSKLYSLFSQV